MLAIDLTSSSEDKAKPRELAISLHVNFSARITNFHVIFIFNLELKYHYPYAPAAAFFEASHGQQARNRSRHQPYPSKLTVNYPQ
jgi:hypothetical protein